MSENTIREGLAFLYGPEAGDRAFAAVRDKLAAFGRAAAARPRAQTPLSERDAILITYGDMLREPGVAPLRTLAGFADARLDGVVSGVHVLPFYPYTSDDGFSVVDYRAVNPDLGGWEDVSALGRRFSLMFDAVINHVSASSHYFQGFLRGDPAWRNLAIVIDDPTDPRLALVTRPRTLPLLTPFQTVDGVKQVWTTFSADQIDLNYGSPAVLLEVLDVLLEYVRRGARLIRLDAIAFMWKTLGTPCVHLPQTHRIIQILRAALDEAAPGTVLITETNVPHADNVSYFGDGTNEAQLVYNFALPPLTVDAFRRGDARALTGWARTLRLPSGQTTFFNFLASHDGIGLNPARGILPEAEVLALAAGTRARGGFVSDKAMPDGSRSPYEMNINFMDAIAPDPSASGPPRFAQRMIAAHAIMLALQGVPGLYFHSLFGSRGWTEGVELLGYNRAVNREKLALSVLDAELADPGSLRRRVFDGLSALLRARAAHPAFDPFSPQEVLDLGPAVFAVRRASQRDRVTCIVNVTDQAQSVSVDLDNASDIVTGQAIDVSDGILRLEPYQVIWASDAPRSS
ncbi:MAG TPA: sugar phosphorylase [Thermoflexales bacterium]|nr:sugar phosphorylase [Thermoflexales bacterium]